MMRLAGTKSNQANFIVKTGKNGRRQRAEQRLQSFCRFDVKAGGIGTERPRIAAMVGRAAMPESRFQVSLWHLFLWITAAAVVCGAAAGIIGHLRYVEARDGSIQPEVVGRSLFFGFIIATAFVGLMIGPPMCYLVALLRSRGRGSAGPK